LTGLTGSTGVTGATGPTGPTGSGSNVAVTEVTVGQNFGRASPGLVISLTADCGPGMRAVSGGIDTTVVNGNDNDLMRTILLSSHAVAVRSWQGTSVVNSRLSQSAELLYAVTAYCIPVP